jgi:lysophospholipase L1-like esterase
MRLNVFEKKMQEIIWNLILATVPSMLVLFIAAELFFRWVIPAAEFPETISDVQNGVLRFNEKGPRDGIYTIGKFAEHSAHWHINNCGWNSEIDYPLQRNHDVPLIAIIGDSYIEAFQVDVTKSVAAQLRRQLHGEWNVYSFGISGAALSQYLQMCRYVANTFNPEVIVINIVHNDFDESIRDLRSNPLFMQLHLAHDGFEEVPAMEYTPSKIRRFLRHSALARYLISNLNVGKLVALDQGKKGQVYNANVDVERVYEAKELIRKGVAYLVKRFREENPGRRIIFMIDAPRADIYKGSLAQSNVYWLNQLLEHECERNSVELIDLTTVFAAHYQDHGEQFNLQHDWHWNELGHRLVAERLAQQIKLPDKIGSALPMATHSGSKATKLPR